MDCPVASGNSPDGRGVAALSQVAQPRGKIGAWLPHCPARAARHGQGKCKAGLKADGIDRGGRSLVPRCARLIFPLTRAPSSPCPTADMEKRTPSWRGPLRSIGLLFRSPRRQLPWTRWRPVAMGTTGRRMRREGGDRSPKDPNLDFALALSARTARLPTVRPAARMRRKPHGQVKRTSLPAGLAEITNSNAAGAGDRANSRLPVPWWPLSGTGATGG